MPDASSARETAEPITAVIADQVRKWREHAGMSQTQLADAMSSLGVKWKRATVVNLEKRGAGSRGDAATGRDALTVGELLALAFVLGVPPVLLVADPRTGAAVVPLGAGREMSPDAALGWLIGVDPVVADGAGVAATGPGHAEFMAAWVRTRHAFEEWKAVRQMRLRLMSKRSGDAVEMRKTERMLRDAYVEAANELGRFLPDQHDRASAFVGDDVPEDD